MKIIITTRNFSWIRSPNHALLQANGDVQVLLVADLQEPPAMIADFISKWEEGYKVAIGVKTQSEEPPLMLSIRKTYYNLVSRLSEIEPLKTFTGFGLYDREVIKVMRRIDDVYPYFRGLIPELGFKTARLLFTQPQRRRGLTSSNLYRPCDVAMLEITNHSKVPFRLVTTLGFALSALSLFTALVCFIYKIVFWNSFSLGGTDRAGAFLLLVSATVPPRRRRWIHRFHPHTGIEKASGG